MNNDSDKLSKIVSLAKRRGFIYQGSEIYGGLAGIYDYGPLGVELKNNITQMWWRRFVKNRTDMYGLDSAVLMNEKVWEASGHTGAGFTDSLVECEKCKKRFRADHIRSDLEEDSPAGEDGKGRTLRCPLCGGKLGDEHKFNLMFETQVGVRGEAKTYLRPETAQGIFTNFKNVVDSIHPKLPFGIAQIGKAFRNEIAPRDFLFRTREFEMMEIEYFVREDEWEKYFEEWKKEIWDWIDSTGLSRKNVRELEVPKDDLAHYSKRTIDFEYNYPSLGFDELLGFAYRTDFDLTRHAKESGVDLSYRDPETGEVFTPHVLEPSFGVDRLIFAILADAYIEDELGGEKRVYLKLKPALAPVKVAVFPLLRNKPDLVKKAREVYEAVKKEIPEIMWDDNGNIGKRYRRQDEIGTPYCITIDFETLEEDSVTVRDRDTGKQERVSINDLTKYLQDIH